MTLWAGVCGLWVVWAGGDRIKTKRRSVCRVCVSDGTSVADALRLSIVEITETLPYRHRHHHRQHQGHCQTARMCRPTTHCRKRPPAPACVRPRPPAIRSPVRSSVCSVVPPLTAGPHAFRRWSSKHAMTSAAALFRGCYDTS